jgi:hypothetical protein
MPIARNAVDSRSFNKKARLPYSLRLKDFEMAMQDIYDFFYDVNLGLVQRAFSVLMTCSGLLSCPASCRTCSHRVSLNTRAA